MKDFIRKIMISNYPLEKYGVVSGQGVTEQNSCGCALCMDTNIADQG
jgi:hypothetical protein